MLYDNTSFFIDTPRYVGYINCGMSALHIFLLFLGGGFGTLSRYAISTGVSALSPTVFPYGTFFVNCIGCFCIGVCFALFEKIAVPQRLQLVLTTGFLGGFTTFSSFAYETTHLLRNKAMLHAVLNILLTNILGIILVVAGMLTAHLILKKTV